MQVIHDFFANYHITDTSLAVGVSGGADSLALVLMLKEVFPSYRIIALTVDHQLRPTSHKEAEYVAQLMKLYQIEHHILVWEGEKPLSGIEEQARQVRYNLLCDWCKQNNVKNLVIAHHLYDQAETFLMRLQRRSGLYGLSSMDEVSHRDGITILRPLLSTSPEVLKAYLKQKNIIWVEDESNQCMDFLRVKMRKFLPILQENIDISPLRIVQAATDLRRVKNFMEQTIDNIIKTSVHQWGNSGYSFDYTEFLSWHEELRFYLIRKLLTLLGGQTYFPESDSLEFLLNQLENDDFSGSTLGNCYIQKSDLRIWIIKEARVKDTFYSLEKWEDYLHYHPEVRGLKIPLKLRQALLLENLSKKI